MDLRKLKTLIDLVAESGISELEITEGDGKVRIVKSPVHVPAAPAPAAQVIHTAPAGTHGAAPSIDRPSLAPTPSCRSARPCAKATRCASSKR